MRGCPARRGVHDRRLAESYTAVEMWGTPASKTTSSPGGSTCPGDETPLIYLNEFVHPSGTKFLHWTVLKTLLNG